MYLIFFQSSPCPLNVMPSRSATAPLYPPRMLGGASISLSTALLSQTSLAHLGGGCFRLLLAPQMLLEILVCPQQIVHQPQYPVSAFRGCRVVIVMEKRASKARQKVERRPGQSLPRRVPRQRQKKLQPQQLIKERNHRKFVTRYARR